MSDQILSSFDGKYKSANYVRLPMEMDVAGNPVPAGRDYFPGAGVELEFTHVAGESFVTLKVTDAHNQWPAGQAADGQKFHLFETGVRSDFLNFGGKTFRETCYVGVGDFMGHFVEIWLAGSDTANPADYHGFWVCPPD